MTLYRKYIRPMHCYPGQHYEPLKEPVENEEKWYPEEERDKLEEKYGYLNEGSFSDLVFDEKYEPYAIEPKFKKLKVSEKCGECKLCDSAITGAAYYVDVNLRPIWCPIVKANEELDRMSIEKRSNLDKFVTGFTSLWGGEDLWD